MPTIQEIEARARCYAEAHAHLAETVGALEAAIRLFKIKSLPGIKKDAAAAAEAKRRLMEAVEESPDLFRRPKSLTLHGVKLGFAKSKGRVEWDAEDKVIARIEKLLPADQAELLIRVKKSVHKPGVYDLTAADLKRLGIKIVGDGDEVVVKIAGADIEKMIDALLDDDDTEQAAA